MVDEQVHGDRDDAVCSKSVSLFLVGVPPGGDFEPSTHVPNSQLK